METMPGAGADGLGGVVATLGLTLLVGSIVYVYFAAMLQTIARKTGTANAWWAWIPILNFVLMCRIAGRPAWWVLLLLVPLVNLIAFAVVWYRIAAVCGKPAWIGVLVVVPVAGLLVPAYLAIGGGERVTGSESTEPAAAGVAEPAHSEEPTGCPGCGAALETGDAFCGECGHAISQAAGPPLASSERARRSSAFYPLAALATVVVIGIVGALGYLGYRWLGGAERDTAPASTIGSQLPEWPAGGPVEETTPVTSPETEDAWPPTRPPTGPPTGPPAGDAGMPATEVPQVVVGPGGSGIEAVFASEEQLLELLAREGEAPPETGVELSEDASGARVEQVLELLDGGGDLDARDSFGRTPLIAAALDGSVDGVGLLLSAGSDVNARDSLGRTALHYARNPEIIGLLVDHGAELNPRDWHGETPLIRAAFEGEAEGVGRLLYHGADGSLRDASDRTACSVAESRGFPEICRMVEAAGAGD